MQQAPGGLDVGARISPREDRLDPHALGLGQILEHVAPLVDLAPLHQGGGTEGLGHGRVERLRPIEDHEQAAIGAESAAVEVGQQALTDRRVLGGAFPQAQRVFAACLIDAQGDDDAVPADLDPVDQ